MNTNTKTAYHAAIDTARTLFDAAITAATTIHDAAVGTAGTVYEADIEAALDTAYDAACDAAPAGSPDRVYGHTFADHSRAAVGAYDAAVAAAHTARINANKAATEALYASYDAAADRYNIKLVAGPFLG